MLSTEGPDFGELALTINGIIESQPYQEGYKVARWEKDIRYNVSKNEIKFYYSLVKTKARSK